MSEERVAENAGVRIAYEVRGRPGVPWAVLVHGLGYPRQGWGPLVDALAERLSLVLVDNRGIGGSDVPEGPYDARMMAGDVLAVLDDLGLDSAHVIGTSLGGMVAIELAVTAPQRVDRLVLLAATPGGQDARPMPEGTQRLLAEVGELDPGEALRRLTANALGPDAAPSVVDEIVQLRVATAQTTAGWQAQAAAGTTYDSGGRERQITAPTLVLHGTHDAVVDPGNAELLAQRIPGARLAWLDRGGHLTPWEAPEHLAEEILDHLDVGEPTERGA